MHHRVTGFRSCPWTPRAHGPIGPRLLWYALGVGTVFHLFVLLYEEPHLKRVFGGEYEDYCVRVNRWLPRGR